MAVLYDSTAISRVPRLTDRVVADTGIKQLGGGGGGAVILEGRHILERALLHHPTVPLPSTSHWVCS